MSAGQPQIELATVEDATAIADCVAAAYQHYIPRLGKPPGPMLDNYAELIRQHTVYIIRGNRALANASRKEAGREEERSTDYPEAEASDSTAVAALLVLMEKVDEGAPGIFLLDNIAVHPQAQGRGYGRALMTLAEEVARERGYEAIHLYTHERMTENIELYKRLGYREAERRIERGFQRVYMQKPILSR